MTSIFVVLYVMLHAHFGLPVGFRFGMYRGEHVDILYGNVKHAFFQVKLLTSSLCLFIYWLIIWVGFLSQEFLGQTSIFTWNEPTAQLMIESEQ